MLDLTKSNKNNRNNNHSLNLTRDTHAYVDIATILSSPDEYVCEQCGIRLLLYPQAQIINPLSRGPSYICPQCHMVTDSSLTGMQHEDKIKPFDVAVPTFTIVPEKKGTEILFEQLERYNDHDPEPDEIERLKNMGCTIKDVKVIIPS